MMKDQEDFDCLIDRIMDLIAAAAYKHGPKDVASQLPSETESKSKHLSTLYGELRRERNHKLGLISAILIMKITGDLAALDKIEALFDRVAFELPAPDSKNICNIMDIMADLTREFSEHMKEVSEALKDGEITKQEAFKCLRELRDLIKVCIKLQAYFESILKES